MEKTNHSASTRPSRGSLGWLVAIGATYIAWLLWLFYVGWMHTVK